MTQPQRAGIYYERRALQEIQRMAAPLRATLSSGRWITYELHSPNTRWQTRHACLDGLIEFQMPAIAVVEVKLNWARARGTKLKTLYAPLIQAMHPNHLVIPILATRCVRDYKGPVWTDLKKLLAELPNDSEPGFDFSMLLVP